MTDLTRLTAENHKLKVANYQLRQQLDAQQINAEAKAIEVECLAGEPAGSTFDWQTLTVVPPAPAADHAPTGE